MALVIGIDSSTQSTKAELRELETGALVAAGRAAHPRTHPPVSEQEPHAWWEALVEAVGQLGDRRREVVAISVAAQQHGMVLVDAQGDSIRPAKLWNDTTSASNASRLVAELGAAWWAESAGVVPVAAFTISKLAWVAEQEPETLDRIDKIMLPHDYLTWRLTGEHVTDRGDASGTGWFDATSNTTLGQPLQVALGDTVDWADRVPHVLGAAEQAGHITSTAATELGVDSSVIVGAGTGDNMGAALGLGLSTGDVVVSLGTSGTVFARSDHRSADTTGAVAGFCDATGGFLPLVCTLNATKVTDTVARWLGTDATGLAELALAAGADSITATLVPYFDGERTPNRPDSMGMMVGLTNVTTREELARAAHDGVVCGVLDGLTALEDAGVDVGGRLLLTGGGAKSAAYRARLADISGRAVHVPENDESVAVGAALQAGVAYSNGLHDFDALVDAWALIPSGVTEPTGCTSGDDVRQRYAAASGFTDDLCG